MWHNGEPRFIDFQGGRTGPPTYDLASLLLDPYVSLPEDLREELLEEYPDRLSRLTAVDAAAFRRRYPFVAAHRVMQTLGAYAYLSGTKGKMHFRRYIPAAAATLERLSRAPALAAFREFRALAERVAAAAVMEVGQCGE
jgi:aminoglycoside/choline kinase family phosphotransferase